MDDYKPKVILTEKELKDARSRFYKTIYSVANVLDKPNPFRQENELVFDINIYTAVNVTNDLNLFIEYQADKIERCLCDHVIIFEPNKDGYSDEVLDKITSSCNVPAYYTKCAEGVLILLNIQSEKNLKIQHSKLSVD